MTNTKRVAAALGLAAGILGTAAAPALAAPSPSPVAPQHTGTACGAVLANNPQAGDEPHSAPPAQTNLFEVGAAFCGITQ
jgi:hypothetical protein